MFFKSIKNNSYHPSFQGSRFTLPYKDISKLLESKSVAEIAKLYNVSTAAVYERMKVFGIKTQRMLNKETNDIFVKAESKENCQNVCNKAQKLIERRALSKISAATDLPQSTILEIASEHYKNGKPKNSSVSAIFNQRKRSEVLERNIPDKDAAEILNMPEKRVAKLRKLMGITKTKSKISRQEKCNLVQSELQNGLTEKEISKKHNIPLSAVKSLIQQINETLS